MSDTSHLFIFGRTPLLSFQELSAFYPAAHMVSQDVAQVDSGLSNESVQVFLDTLGGTVKIAQVIAQTDQLDWSLATHLSRESSLTFGVSTYGGLTLPKNLLTDMKKVLESEGVVSRYVTPHEGDVLSSVTLDKKHVQELVIFRSGSGYCVGKTVAVQNYEVWANRDIGRPFADGKNGMLPVKVARMLVNISLKEAVGNTEMRQKTILDPFCGMGTILAEAYLRGCRVLGSDVSGEITAKAKANLQWLMTKFPNERGSVAKVFMADAVHIAEELPPQSVHAIITEPFMGSPDIALHTEVDIMKAKNQLKGLEKLFIGCLRNWHNVLIDGGTILIALPSYKVNGRELTVKKVVDMCENLGYTIEAGPIEYSRPQAIVKRQFYLFKKI